MDKSAEGELDWNKWRVRANDARNARDELLDALGMAAAWCRNCGGAGTAVSWDGDKTIRVDCTVCAKARALITKHGGTP